MSKLTEEQKTEIVRLYQQGYGHKAVAKMMGISRDSVRYHINKCGIVRSLVNQYCDKDPETAFSKRFNIRYLNQFEYVSGYENCESDISIKCLKCGAIITRCAHNYISKNKVIRCECCNELLKTQDKLRRATIKILLSEIKGIKNIAVIKEKTAMENHYDCVCKNCGKSFKSKTDSRKYCCSYCMNRFNNSTKKHKKRERVIKNGRYEDISLNLLVRKKRNRCHICGGECDYKDIKQNVNGHRVYGPMYPTIDHIIPICKGGTNTWDNVDLAHMGCNCKKSGSSVLVMNGDRIAFNI